jgi:cysteine-rich repeat protein
MPLFSIVKAWETNEFHISGQDDISFLKINDIHNHTNKMFLINGQSHAHLNHRRRLAGPTSPSLSTISGNGTSGSVTALQSYKVIVTAKDEYGNNQGFGGDNFKIQIRNKWVKTGDFEWNPTTSTKDPLTSPIIATMTDNNDGTYTYDYTIQLDGEVSVLVSLENTGVFAEYWDNYAYSGTPDVRNFSNTLNYNWGGGNVTPSNDDYVTGRFYTKLKAPATATYTIFAFYDDGIILKIDNIVKINDPRDRWYQETNFTMNLVQDQYYSVEIEWRESVLGACLNLSWAYNSVPKQIIPNIYLGKSEFVSSSPYQGVVTCPTGYTGEDPNHPTTCYPIWADGLRVGSEGCDDTNLIPSDGCNTTWQIEPGYECSGGSPTSQDVWNLICSNSKRDTGEQWDDGNISDNDGCDSDCNIENGWECSGGTSSSPDTWNLKCSNGKRDTGEQWDDGNTNNSDGCDSDCNVENGWEWSGGTSSTPDTCNLKCGNGRKNIGEGWEDSNIANGDGCSSTYLYTKSFYQIKKCNQMLITHIIWYYNPAYNSTWTIESGWECSGGTPSSPDSCNLLCSNGKRNSGEEWDDGNLLNNDGCDNSCKVEFGYQCMGGTLTTPDVWALEWGDGRRTENEECDDDNKANNDGCSDTCKIEDEYVCTGGSLNSRDYWITWEPGYERNKDNSECIPSELSTTETAAVVGMGTAVSAGAGINVLSAVMTNSSPQSTLSMVNQIQLFLLLPMINAFVPTNIINVIIGMSVSLFSFDFIPIEKVSFLEDILEKLNYEQASDYLNLIGFESGSTLVNIKGTILVLLLIIFIHFLIIPCYLYSRRGKHSYHFDLTYHI